VELILEFTGDLCPDVVDYEFQSVLRLMADYRRGRFAPAFQPEWRATVHEANPNPVAWDGTPLGCLPSSMPTAPANPKSLGSAP
jgi:hypothetical protein